MYYFYYRLDDFKETCLSKHIFVPHFWASVHGISNDSFSRIFLWTKYVFYRTTGILAFRSSKFIPQG